MTSPQLQTLVTCALSTENVTEIKTDIFVTSFGPVSDTEMVSSSSANTVDTKRETGVAHTRLCSPPKTQAYTFPILRPSPCLQFLVNEAE